MTSWNKIGNENTIATRFNDDRIDTGFDKVVQVKLLT